jgi:hypothetical protein
MWDVCLTGFAIHGSVFTQHPGEELIYINNTQHSLYTHTPLYKMLTKLKASGCAPIPDCRLSASRFIVICLLC